MTASHATSVAAAALAAVLVFAMPAAAQQAKGKQSAAQGGQRIGDWKLVCAPSTPCFITQEVVDAETKAGLAGIAVAKPPGRPNGVMQVNLAPQIDPKQPIGLSVDGGAPAPLQVNGCDAAKCSARAVLPDDVLERLRKGNEIILTFGLPNQTQLAAVKFSLKGFTAAYKALEAKRG
ncbi:invasion associated locus B family protein [Arenibaculum pallidiluteum]|uniref:invasion associated locus B family protein n=1 Tax=Arenibaculum pallidiluteum TaxID=2812559 RepID=UPI001A96F996|nr:invasion associated locus B family protein [Arenibaculum pallidiluteum]